MKHESDGDTNCTWCTRNGPLRLDNGAGRVRNRRQSRDHPNYSINEIGQNTEKRPSNLKRLAVTQTPMKGRQLTLVLKIRKK